MESPFTWARLTVLALFPRSCLPSKSFVKFSMMCSCERVGWFSSRGIGFSNEISQAMVGVKVKTLCFVMFP